MNLSAAIGQLGQVTHFILVIIYTSTPWCPLVLCMFAVMALFILLILVLVFVMPIVQEEAAAADIYCARAESEFILIFKTVHAGGIAPPFF